MTYKHLRDARWGSPEEQYSDNDYDVKGESRFHPARGEERGRRGRRKIMDSEGDSVRMYGDFYKYIYTHIQTAYIDNACIMESAYALKSITQLTPLPLPAPL